MLIVDVRADLNKYGMEVAEAAARPRRYAASTLQTQADVVLAIATGNVCVGAFEVLSTHRDSDPMLDLRKSERYWPLVGQILPVPPARNPARIASGKTIMAISDLLASS